MLLTSLLHGVTQLRHEARDTLESINPLWDFELLSLPFFKMAKNRFNQTVPLNISIQQLYYSNIFCPRFTTETL